MQSTLSDVDAHTSLSAYRWMCVHTEQSSFNIAGQYKNSFWHCLNLSTHTHTHTHIHEITHTHSHTHMRSHTHTHTHTHTRDHTHTHTHTHTMRSHTHTHTHTHEITHTHRHTRSHTHPHTHEITHTDSSSELLCLTLLPAANQDLLYCTPTPYPVVHCKDEGTWQHALKICTPYISSCHNNVTMFHFNISSVFISVSHESWKE